MNKLKKLFCRCNNSVEIISNRKGILQFGECKICGKYWFINLEFNSMLPLKEDEYFKLKKELEQFEKELRSLGNEKEN